MGVFRSRLGQVQSAFNGSRYLVERTGFLMEAWIIAPSVSELNRRVTSVNSSSSAKWSDFVCANIDLDGVEIVLVRDGQS